MAVIEISAAPSTKNILTSAGPEDETNNFVDSVHFSPMEAAGVHCSVQKSEKPRSRTGSLAISESRTYSTVGKHVSHRSSRATSKQTRQDPWPYQNLVPTLQCGNMSPIARLARHQNKPDRIPGRIRISYLFYSGETCLPSLVSRDIKTNQTESLAVSESRTYSTVGKHVSHRSSRATSKQTRISTKRCSASRDKKREGSQSCTDASTCERDPCNDPETLSIVRNQIETPMGPVPMQQN